MEEKFSHIKNVHQFPPQWFWIIFPVYVVMYILLEQCVYYSKHKLLFSTSEWKICHKDIVTHLLYTTSYVTFEEAKNYKSLNISLLDGS